MISEKDNIYGQSHKNVYYEHRNKSILQLKLSKYISFKWYYF